MSAGFDNEGCFVTCGYVLHRFSTGVNDRKERRREKLYLALVGAVLDA